MSEKHKKIILESYGTGLNYQYTGRFLGFVNEQNFRDLVRSRDIQKNLLTSESVNLGDLITAASNDDKAMTGKRLVLAVSESNNVYKTGVLFVTQILGMSTYISPDTRNIGVMSMDNEAYINIEEVK